MLTLDAYRESGGGEGAIAKRADTINNGFSSDQQTIVRRLMLRLTQPGEGTEDTRRRVKMSEIITNTNESDTIEGVVRVMADARLLTMSGDDQTDERWVDVSHEALIRGWPKLRGDEDHVGLCVHRRLTEAVQEWQRLNQDEDVLYRGARLMAVEEWRPHNEVAMNELEPAFLDTSIALREQKRAARERRVAISNQLVA